MNKYHKSLGILLVVPIIVSFLHYVFAPSYMQGFVRVFLSILVGWIIFLSEYYVVKVFVRVKSAKVQ